VTDRKTITLGDRGEVGIRPIDLGMLKAIGIGSARMQSAPTADNVKKEGLWYDGTFEVIAVGTGLTIEEVTAITGVTLEQLVKASRTIFEITGLIVEKPDEKKKKSNQPGEGNGASVG
jgi:hypothetical protein